MTQTHFWKSYEKLNVSFLIGSIPCNNTSDKKKKKEKKEKKHKKEKRSQEGTTTPESNSSFGSTGSQPSIATLNVPLSISTSSLALAKPRDRASKVALNHRSTFDKKMWQKMMQSGEYSPDS
jgi:hypothetical protein